jgi:uncharacterized RDD family membrane protein YckC
MQMEAIMTTHKQMLDLPLAGYERRFGAFIVDLAAAFPAVIVGIVAFYASFWGSIEFIDAEGTIAPWDVWDILQVVAVGPFAATVVAAFIFVPCWARSQTPGKALRNLEVVDRSGRPTNFGRMLVREILLKRILVGFLWLTLIGPIIWYLWPLWDKQRRAPHDIILGTHVARKV